MPTRRCVQTNLKPRTVPAVLLSVLPNRRVFDTVHLLSGRWHFFIVRRCTAMLTPRLACTVDVECDGANGALKEWHGTVYVYPPSATRGSQASAAHSPPPQDVTNVDLQNLVLADCVLKNTAYAVGRSRSHHSLSELRVSTTSQCLGLVIYTGESTKIRKNMEAQTLHQRQKESSVFALTRRFFVAMVCVQVFHSLVTAPEPL